MEKLTELDYPDREWLLTVIEYNPDDGLFRWLMHTHGRQGAIRPGDVAGTFKNGYVQIKIAGHTYRAHLLAWWIVMGELPPPGYEVDHESRGRSDNRWDNLRLMTRSGNNHNSMPSISNKSGVKGVSWCAARGKWDARITLGSQVVLLGRHTEYADAVKARIAAEQQHGIVSNTEVPDAPPYTPRRIVNRRRPTDEAVRVMKVSTAKRSTNTSGHPGVCFHKPSKLWRARMTVKGRDIVVGYFKSFDEAKTARIAAENERFGVLLQT